MTVRTSKARSIGDNLRAVLAETQRLRIRAVPQPLAQTDAGRPQAPDQGGSDPGTDARRCGKSAAKSRTRPSPPNSPRFFLIIARLALSSRNARRIDDEHENLCE